MTPETYERRPAGNGTAFQAQTSTVTHGTRCACCGRLIRAEVSVRRGVGPECWVRLRNAQRHERHEAVHARLRGLLRRLGDLDMEGLALVAAALSDLEDALTGGASC